MSDPRGSVPFDVKGGPHPGAYTLLLDFNALCDLEQEFPGLMDGTAEITGLRSIRKVFRAGLGNQVDQGSDDADERFAGALIHELGMSRASDLIGDAMKAAFPEVAKGGKAGPRKRTGAGTGAKP